MGGETDAAIVYQHSGWGLPPRGRGNHRREPFLEVHRGSTPAWAGKPMTSAIVCGDNGVYPRVGGETQATPQTTGHSRGLPPRGRGNRLGDCPPALYLRSTPAWAGKPFHPGLDVGDLGVYPRVGGETWAASSARTWATGLPPRGRGNRHQAWPYPLWCRSTPAWAGKPCTRRRAMIAIWVYPRVGGETPLAGT